jgi:hypothetical protein
MFKSKKCLKLKMFKIRKCSNIYKKFRFIKYSNPKNAQNSKIVQIIKKCSHFKSFGFGK